MVSTNGIISTIAGNGFAGYSGDGGQATNAELNGIESLAFDYAGNLYLADQGNYHIRMVNTAGIISTIAGNGNLGYSGDGGQATAAAIDEPNGVTCDMAGNLYISEGASVRKVNTNGIISTIAGNETQGYSGDGGQATLAELNIVGQVAFDATGNMYIADGNNNRIRKVTNVGQMSIQQVAVNSEQVSVYLNPASEILNVVLREAQDDNATVVITDMIGGIIYRSTFSAQHYTIPVAKFASGVYIIEVNNSKGSACKKFIKE